MAVLAIGFKASAKLFILRFQALNPGGHLPVSCFQVEHFSTQLPVLRFKGFDADDQPKGQLS